MSAIPRKPYRFLSGPDDAAFCARVSEALAEGYVLYGDPVMVIDDGARIVGQAICLPDVHPVTGYNQETDGASK
ncbi:MAG: DUF1737 domain-containing protein [Alphaproteobacteria bacterium]|jgi:hypothetical protein|nr:DUF1737 domain-containing protein [Alphaproteobacteria bacterium]